MPVRLLRDRLAPEDKTYLHSLLTGACESPPSGWRPWFLAGHPQPLGVIAPEHAATLQRLLPASAPLLDTASGWMWLADAPGELARSRLLQSLAVSLRESGAIAGWRNEDFACWGQLGNEWPYAQAPLFRLERSAFRYFGLRSHASHVHGITPDGRMWCGRRSLSKATDPGLLDNLAAGGLPVREDPLQCVLREIEEEAGIRCRSDDLEPGVLSVLTERRVAEGWHSERLFIYTLPLPADAVPENQDGEVSEFVCLTLQELLQRMRGGEFSRDAACAIAALLVPPVPARSLPFESRA